MAKKRVGKRHWSVRNKNATKEMRDLLGLKHEWLVKYFKDLPADGDATTDTAIGHLKRVFGSATRRKNIDKAYAQAVKELKNEQVAYKEKDGLRNKSEGPFPLSMYFTSLLTELTGELGRHKVVGATLFKHSNGWELMAVRGDKSLKVVRI